MNKNDLKNILKKRISHETYLRIKTFVVKFRKMKKDIKNALTRIMRLTVGAIAEKIVLLLEKWRFVEFSVFYAQCGEDIIIYDLLKKLKNSPYLYLDIGANDPKVLSNTYFLYRKGSRGILVEPNLGVCKRLESVRKGDVILNCGVAERPGKLTYYLMNIDTLNTFSRENAEKCVEYGSKIIGRKEIEVVTINQIMEKECSGGVDFLSIDVEGKDFTILKTLDFEKYAPIIICMETQEYCGGKRNDLEEINQFLDEKGYMIYADTMLNTVYVKRQEYIQYIKNLECR